jgi:glutaredoxin
MNTKLTLIKRSTPYCPHCVEQESKLLEAGIEFNTIDIALDTEAISKYNIMSVPVMIFESEFGELRLNGLQPIELVNEMLED